MSETLELDDGSEVELYYDSDNYTDKHIFQDGNYLIVAYLSPEESPHVEEEFYDKFHDDDNESKWAFGFDKYGSKSFDSIDDADLLDFLREKITTEFHSKQPGGWHEKAFYLVMPLNLNVDAFDEKALNLVLNAIESIDEMNEFIDVTESWTIFESLKDDLWLAKCKAGDIGDLYAVPLKSRNSMQIDKNYNYQDAPDWAFIPNDNDKENIHIKVAEIYGYEFNYDNSQVEVTNESGVKTLFPGYCDAVKSILPELRKQNDFSERVREVAKEIAESHLVDYNALNDGDVYGICVEHFIRERDDVDEEWIQIIDDAHWGCIGTECAKSELKNYFDHALENCKEPEFIAKQRAELFGDGVEQRL